MQGAQEPRVSSVPPYASSTGDEAIELAALAGINLDPWQQLILRHSLGERPDGRWAAFEVGIVCPRQNGKNEILLARELAGLFLLGERLIVHSAHHFGTAREHFRRMIAVIEDTSDFSRRLKKNGIKTANGNEGIELKGGQRFALKAREKGTVRGFTADCVVFDEAWQVAETTHGAVIPTLSTRPNPQILYAGTAVDQWAHDHGVILARIRERGMAGDDPALAYFEWSLDAENPSAVDEATAADPEVWAQVNPALGIRISSEYIANEHRSLDARSYAVERLGVGDWPATDGLADQVISAEQWGACHGAGAQLLDPVCFAFDVTPNQSGAAIAVAGRREDGLIQVEIVEHEQGTGWVAGSLGALAQEHQPAAVICDTGSTANALAQPVEEALNEEPLKMSTRDYGQACAMFYDAVDQGTLRHMGEGGLDSAVKGAVKKPMGDAWKWSRTTSTADISPLVAATLALWGVQTQDTSSIYEERGVLVL